MQPAARLRPALGWWDRLGLTALGLGLGLNAWLGQAVREAALEGARASARDAVEEVLLNRLRPEDLEGPMAGERLAEFDRFIRETILSRGTVRVKISNGRGQVAYSRRG